MNLSTLSTIKLWIILFFTIGLFSQSCTLTIARNQNIKQGVEGKVSVVHANVLTSDTSKHSSERALIIYKLTTRKQIVVISPSFTAVNSDFVSTAQTNEDGFFQCKLSPGKYSIFVMAKNKTFYGDFLKGTDQISPFEVKDNEVVTHNIVIKEPNF
ncbi:hypothetical protein [Pedobacter mucosus]|uniref:hypothetical protein n=1 Tax=Pedobacter mucosus TaxID=2895286 RepID=UPI001EE3A884|nr:hypothetical protein [Pedobacter mucosus]UKT62695.1 hypothetical protein LOK61_13090 [Pedobacter mucosus]